MAELVRDHVRLREVAGRAEPLRELAKELEIEIHLSVLPTVERPGRRLREAARRIDRAAKQHDARVLVARAKDFAPRALDISCDRVDEVDLALFGGRTADSARRFGRRRPRSVAGAEEGKEVRTGRPAEHEQHEETAEGDRHGANAARAAAHVLDVAAIAWRPSHGATSSKNKA